MRSRVVLVAVLAGCGPAAQGGLTNAPSTSRPSTPEDRGEDAIANSPRSCPSSGKQADDPLRGRYPQCPELRPGAARAGSSR